MSSSQPARSAAWLTSRLSLGGSNPAVFPGKTPGCCRRRYPPFLSLPLSSHLSVSLQSCRVNWQHWQSSVSAAGSLCTETVAGELKTFTGRIRVHRNGSLLLFASSWQAWLTPQNLPVSLFSFVFLLSVFLSVRSPGWSCVYSRAGSWQRGDKCWGWVDERQRSEGGKGTNERDSHSRGLSLHLQITAPLTLFDIGPKWPGRSIFSL